jgi:glutaredoxin 3
MELVRGVGRVRIYQEQDSGMRIKIYTKSSCNYCYAAKHLLAKASLAYEEIPVLDASTALEMQQLTGRTSVPQVFIDDLPIGGYQELSRMISDGSLQTAA